MIQDADGLSAYSHCCCTTTAGTHIDIETKKQIEPGQLLVVYRHVPYDDEDPGINPDWHRIVGETYEQQ